MTSELQQAINLAQSLSLAEQLELLKKLSAIVQRTYALETPPTTQEDTDFSTASFHQSWQQV
jgi:hypothetical protein